MEIAPELRKVQEKYKGKKDQLSREAMSRETMALYKKHGTTPVSSCLPLLVQMPVFLVLYQVLSGLTRRESGLGFDTGWISSQASQGAGLTTPPSIDRPFDPAFLNESSSLYQSLAGNTQMEAFGLDLAESASKALSAGILHAIPYLVLIAIVAATGFIQQRQIQGRNPNAQINPQQQMIMKIMPIFLPVISFGLPAGLVLYFAVSNMYRIGQQAFISRSIYGMRKGQGSVLARSGAGSEPAEAPTQSLREAFGLARRNAKEVGERKAKASSGKNGGTGRAKSSAKAASTTKGASRTASSRSTGAAKAKPSDTRGAPKDTGSGGGQPTLQPRARKNQKKR
jgi:YidC/Oxa1 family membrane protein insertase